MCYVRAIRSAGAQFRRDCSVYYDQNGSRQVDALVGSTLLRCVFPPRCSCYAGRSSRNKWGACGNPRRFFQEFRVSRETVWSLAALTGIGQDFFESSHRDSLSFEPDCFLRLAFCLSDRGHTAFFLLAPGIVPAGFLSPSTHVCEIFCVRSLGRLIWARHLSLSSV